MTAGPNPPGSQPPGPGQNPAEETAAPTDPLPPAYDPWAAAVEESFPDEHSYPPRPSPPVGRPPEPPSPPAAAPAASTAPGQGSPPGFAPGSAPVPPAPPPSTLPPPGWQPPAGATQQWPGAYPPAATVATRPRSGTAVKVVSIVGALVLLACAGCAVLILPGVIEALKNPDGGTSVANPPTGTAATSTATGRPSAPSGPFAGTPAEDYPLGEAGITLPDPEAVEGFTADEVGAALQQVRKGLIAARLDRRMLIDGDPSGLISLLALDARDGIEQDFDDGSFLSFASQVAPGHSLTPDPPRVKGKITFRATEDDGIRLLEIVTNFVWVYPFVGQASDPGENLVIVHDEVSWVFPVREDVEPSSRGMWIDAAESYASNIDCEMLESSLLALGEPALATDGTGEDDETMFDPDRSLNIEETC